MPCQHAALDPGRGLLLLLLAVRGPGLLLLLLRTPRRAAGRRLAGAVGPGRALPGAARPPLASSWP